MKIQVTKCSECPLWNYDGWSGGTCEHPAVDLKSKLSPWFADQLPTDCPLFKDPVKLEAVARK